LNQSYIKKKQLFIANRSNIDLIGYPMTKKTKEAIKTTAVIIIVILAVFGLWIYPLNQAGKIIVRPDQEEAPAANPDEFGLKADTISVTTEDNIKLFCLYFGADSSLGTVILIHGLKESLLSQLPKAEALLDAGFNVAVYDQRGYGLSEGEYRSGGYFEANDLQAVISRLDLEDRLFHPVLVWGEEHGAAAAVRLWRNESRIDYIMAENPVINGRDWQKRVVEYRDMSAPDFYLPLIWWWMKLKSGYEIPIEETDITDRIGTAFEKMPGRLMVMACGDGGRPKNEYVAELVPIGGNWKVMPCSEGNLFEKNQRESISAVEGMVKASGRSEEDAVRQ
jgi:pimeloyl-ACP methyl ester carboxylesterase